MGVILKGLAACVSGEVISSLHSWSAAHAFSVAFLHRSGELEGRGAGKLGTFSWSRSWSTGFLRSLTVRPVISVDVKSSVNYIDATQHHRHREGLQDCVFTAI